MVPESGPTVGSRSTTLMGNAIILAVNQVKASILETAAQMLQVPEERLEARDRIIYDRSDPSRALPFQASGRQVHEPGQTVDRPGLVDPAASTLDPETGQGNPYFVYTYSTHMAEVVVDVETGKVDVTDYVAAFDIGQGHQSQERGRTDRGRCGHGAGIRHDGGTDPEGRGSTEPRPAETTDPHRPRCSPGSSRSSWRSPDSTVPTGQGDRRNAQYPGYPAILNAIAKRLRRRVRSPPCRRKGLPGHPGSRRTTEGIKPD